MWILILTLSVYNAGVNMMQVSGFHSRQSCLTAGNVWVKNLKPFDGAPQIGSAVCVEQ